MNKNIFREKNLDKISSPEKLDDYIKVTTPGMWFVLTAIIILLFGAGIWGFFGEVEIHNPDGSTEVVAPITFIMN